MKISNFDFFTILAHFGIHHHWLPMQLKHVWYDAINIIVQEHLEHVYYCTTSRQYFRIFIVGIL